MIAIATVSQEHPTTPSSGPAVFDGRIVAVNRLLGSLSVIVDVTLSGALPGRHGRRQRLTLSFQGVEEMIAVHPERMMFASLTESPAGPLLRRFAFENWFQPGDDWDPYLAACRLEIVARDVTVE
jgi:hypothetical protein